MSRLIDADAFERAVMFSDDEDMQDIIYRLRDFPTIEPEHKKDAIQKFHDYQVKWLLSHCDLELEPQLEEYVVRFLHDTANCYMMEIDRGECD